MAVATAIAVGGLALSAATTANSFIQAGKQKKAQRAAEDAAAEAMAEAKKKLEINYADELAIKKEPYELQREAMLSQGAQAIEAGVESERGAAATAGKIQMAQNEAQAGIRTEMGKEMDAIQAQQIAEDSRLRDSKEMDAIQAQQIAEDSRLRDLGVQLDLGEAEGAQNAARSAEEASTAATAQGIQGVMSTAQQGLGMVNLYPATGAAPAAGAPAENSLGSSLFKPMQTANTTFTKPFGMNAQQVGPGGALANNQPNFALKTPSLFTKYDAFGNPIK